MERQAYRSYHYPLGEKYRFNFKLYITVRSIGRKNLGKGKSS